VDGKTIGFGIFLGLAGLGGVMQALESAKPPPLPSVIVTPSATARAEPAERKSRECVLSADGSPSLVCPTEEGLEEYIQAAVRKDRQAMNVAAVENTCFPIRERTRCAYLDRGFARSRVRVLEGTQEGRSGWLPTEFTRE
jgi:hypothetical protein